VEKSENLDNAFYVFRFLNDTSKNVKSRVFWILKNVKTYSPTMIGTSSFKMRSNILPFLRCNNWNITIHAGFVMAIKLLLSNFAICIRLLAWQVFANVTAWWRCSILLFNSRGSCACCLVSRRRFNVNMGFTDDDGKSVHF